MNQFVSEAHIGTVRLVDTPLRGSSATTSRFESERCGIRLLLKSKTTFFTRILRERMQKQRKNIQRDGRFRRFPFFNTIKRLYEALYAATKSTMLVPAHRRYTHEIYLDDYRYPKTRLQIKILAFKPQSVHMYTFADFVWIIWETEQSSNYKTNCSELLLLLLLPFSVREMTSRRMLLP
jgi:hypothetical protein